VTQAFSLKPGDVVTYDLEDYVVESRYAYSTPTGAWSEWVLNPGATDSRLTIALADAALYVGRPCFMEGRPGDQTIRVNGELYDLRRTGKADTTVTYDTGASQYDRAEFWHYRDDAGAWVFVRRGHLGEWALALAPATPEMLTVYGA
jgi:hypothetical protein